MLEIVAFSPPESGGTFCQGTFERVHIVTYKAKRTHWEAFSFLDFGVPALAAQTVVESAPLSPNFDFDAQKTRAPDSG